MSILSDAGSREPEIKYLVEDLCETFQDGIVIYDERVRHLAIGQDGKRAEELRESFERGHQELGRAYRNYYRQAGKHFAYGDSDIQSELANHLHILTIQVIEILQHSPDDAISGIPHLPGSFRRYVIVDYTLLFRKSEYIRKVSLKSLKDLFSKISEWAVPLHTLPPLASQPTGSSTPEDEHEKETFFEKIRAPFHRQRYEYEELPTQYTFRLVKVLTSRPYVTCEITTFHLSDPPPFQALSYCWGKYGQTSDIWCNGRLFKVSSNLKKGLQRLDKYGAWSRVRYFWIDQICINQKDFAERTQQVRLMRAIYQRAQNTVIWLGPDDGNTRDAFSLTTDIYQYSLGTAAKNEHVVIGQRLPTSIELPSEEDKRWAGLSRFLELAWFERCWIIQEVVVSKGDPVILCGGFQMLWSRFQDAMMWLMKHNAGYRTDRMKLINSIFELSSTRDVWELQSLLHSTRSFQATDPRDKVFALFGLSGESRTPDSWPKALLPNYGRSTRDVYTEVTLYCIQRTRTLTILSQVDNEPGDDMEYPSWVPRWDVRHSAGSLSAYAVVRSATDCKFLTERFNSASKDLPVSRDSYTPSDVLRLEGIRISTVQSCLPAMLPDQTADSSISPNAPSHTDLPKKIPELYEMCRSHLSHLTPEDFSRTFLLVTTAGLTVEQENARHESIAHFRAFLSSTAPKTPESEHDGDSMYSLSAALKSSLSVSTLNPAVSPPRSTDTLRTPFYRSRSSPSTLSSLSAEDQADPTRYTSALAPLLHRRLFITSSGHLGLGPSSMMSGDVMVVLFGGKVPFVLRAVAEDQWKLVGECYVDGFMEGEAIDSRQRNAAKRDLGTEWFDLV